MTKSPTLSRRKGPKTSSSSSSSSFPSSSSSFPSSTTSSSSSSSSIPHANVNASTQGLFSSPLLPSSFSPLQASSPIPSISPSFPSTSSSASSSSSPPLASPTSIPPNPPSSSSSSSSGNEDFFSVVWSCGVEFDELVDLVFSRYQFMEVVGTWLVILVSDIAVGFPIEWVVFSLLSIYGYYRAFLTGFQALFAYSALITLLDSAVYLAIVPFGHFAWLPVLANMVIHAYVICSVRGHDVLSWFLWFAFVAYDVYFRDIPVSPIFFHAAIHSIGFGLFLLLTEIARPSFRLSEVFSSSSSPLLIRRGDHQQPQQHLRLRHHLHPDHQHRRPQDPFDGLFTDENHGNNLTPFLKIEPNLKALQSLDDCLDLCLVGITESTVTIEWLLRTPLLQPNLSIPEPTPALQYHQNPERGHEDSKERSHGGEGAQNDPKAKSSSSASSSSEKRKDSGPSKKSAISSTAVPTNASVNPTIVPWTPEPDADNSENIFRKLKEILFSDPPDSQPQPPPPQPTPTPEEQTPVTVYSQISQGQYELSVLLNHEPVQQNIQFDFDRRSFTLGHLNPSSNYEVRLLLRTGNSVLASLPARFCSNPKAGESSPSSHEDDGENGSEEGERERGSDEESDGGGEDHESDRESENEAEGSVGSEDAESRDGHGSDQSVNSDEEAEENGEDLDDEGEGRGDAETAEGKPPGQEESPNSTEGKKQNKSASRLLFQRYQELIEELEVEKNAKKDSASNLKKIKREAQKNETTLKTELAAIQASLQRDEARDKREKQRATFLAETIRQIEAANMEMEEEVKFLREENIHLQAAAEKAHIELETQKESLRRLEKQLLKVQTANQKTMTELERDQARLAKERANHKGDLEGLEAEMAEMEKRIVAVNDDIVRLRVKEIAGRNAQSEAQKALATMEASFESNKHSIEQMMVALETKNERLRHTLAEERRFKQNLLEELAHFNPTTVNFEDLWRN